jgi:hypothetical protein
MNNPLSIPFFEGKIRGFFGIFFFFNGKDSEKYD